MPVCRSVPWPLIVTSGTYTALCCADWKGPLGPCGVDRAKHALPACAAVDTAKPAVADAPNPGGAPRWSAALLGTEGPWARGIGIHVGGGCLVWCMQIG
eukprot:1158357-Pelagomonas_calceolata.AAC.5